MKNKIIYGEPESEKTKNYFNPVVEHWEGKIIAVSREKREIDGFKIFYLDKPNKSFRDILINDKVLLLENLECDPYFNMIGMKNMIINFLENISTLDIDKPILLAIDDFSDFNLSEKLDNNQSLLLSLLKLKGVNIYLVMRDLHEIKKVYKDEYKEIISLCDTVCTKEIENYSGELRVRFPRSLHKYLKEEADREGISLNQYIIYQLTKIMVSNEFNKD